MHIMWDWDEDKRRANRLKHGVDFSYADRIDWSSATVEPDLRRDYGEDRMILTGMVEERLHVLIYTERLGRKRIISLRKANGREFDRWISHAG
jgi:uncharacterized DUF497 family protein